MLLERTRGTIPAGAGSSGRASWYYYGLWDHPRGRGEQAGGRLGPRCGRGPSPRARGAAVHPGGEEVRGGTIPAGAGSRYALPAALVGRRDHPRGRGEQATRTAGEGSGKGPSPRARGAVPRHPPPAAHPGTIPAGAGSSSRSRSRVWPAGDHPRGRGEQLGCGSGTYAAMGPSPRARGAELHQLGEADRLGTIPAGAGSRSRTSRRAPSGRDHPRGRGEQWMTVARANWAGGPSPRARGAASCGECLRRGGGTIPAGAGSRRPGRCANCPTGDHPRGRGEQTESEPMPGRFEGPSPRARGAAAVVLVRPVRGGTIPAGAGSRPRSAGAWWCRGDHPRGRGEQVSGSAKSTAEGGPSPRARGADLAGGVREVVPGTIPAGAGSRCARRAAGRPGRDHPRGRGEQEARYMATRSDEGPSPRARGAGHRQGHGPVADGTIPAGAGSRGPRPAPGRSPRDHPLGRGEQ